MDDFEMNITQSKMVTTVYCDNCGKKAGLPRYGVDGKDYCANCKPWNLSDIKREWAHAEILKQPFAAEPPQANDINI